MWYSTGLWPSSVTAWALIAFELARLLRAKGVEPVQVFASGCKAPHLPGGRSKHRRHLPDREFIAAVGDMKGVSREVLRNADLMDVVLSVPWK